MKKLILLINVLFFHLIFNSCEQETVNPLYNQIVGEWKVITIKKNLGSKQETLKLIDHFGQNRKISTVTLYEDGRFAVEDNLGNNVTGLINWKIVGNGLIVSELFIGMKTTTITYQANIMELTKYKWHFVLMGERHGIVTSYEFNLYRQ
jgi:hypothetical protein